MAFKKIISRIIAGVRTAVIFLIGMGWKRWGAVALLAGFLTFLNLRASYIPILPDYEKIVFATTIKKWFSKYTLREDKFTPEHIARDFMLIDMSNDISFFSDTTAADNSFIPADSPFVFPVYPKYDIRRLTGLFKWLSENPDMYNTVICNINLHELTISGNRELAGYINKMATATPHSKVLLPGLYDAEQENFHGFADTTKLVAHISPDAWGVVNEELVQDKFFTYRMSYNKGAMKTLPLRMLESINGYKFNSPDLSGGIEYTQADTAYYGNNTFIPEILFTPEDIQSVSSFAKTNGTFYDSTVGKIELWQALLSFDTTACYHLCELLKTGHRRKSIFIDAFTPVSAARHSTIYGDVSGGVVLLNLYYNLLLKENNITRSYLLFTVCCFIVIAFMVLYTSKRPRPAPTGWFTSAIRSIIVEEMHLWALVVMTILSSLLFDSVSNVLVLAPLLVLISKLIEARRKVRRPAQVNPQLPSQAHSQPQPQPQSQSQPQPQPQQQPQPQPQSQSQSQTQSQSQSQTQSQP